MSPRERGLGRGLSALLGEAASTGAVGNGEARTVATADLVAGPFQPRRNFDAPEMESLAASIRARGIMQPILVRPDPERRGGYQIVAGARRKWRSSTRCR